MATERPVNEAEDLRDAAREAHEAMADLKVLMKEARELLDEFKRTPHDYIDEQLVVEVKAGLDQYQEQITSLTDYAREQVIKRFDAMYDLLMGKTPSQMKINGVDMETIVGHVAVGDPNAVKRMIEEQLKINPVEGVVP